MGYFSLILLVYLSYKNGMRAKLKEQNVIAWALISGVSFFITEIIGAAIVIFYFCQGVVDINRLATDPSYKNIAAKQLTDAFAQNPLHSITVDLFGIGGYLIVRYILDKKPDKKQPEVNWMDKMGEQ